MGPAPFEDLPTSLRLDPAAVTSTILSEDTSPVIVVLGPSLLLGSFALGDTSGRIPIFVVDADSVLLAVSPDRVPALKSSPAFLAIDKAASTLSVDGDA